MKCLSIAVGLGLELVWLAVPQAYPNIPNVLWVSVSWAGLALIAIPCVVLFFSYLKDWKAYIDPEETIPAHEAMKVIATARPNSDETTAINLADATRLGQIRSWGRPILEMAIPDHTTATEQIPPDVWGYGLIDPSLINGPVPQSRMKYRQKFLEDHVEDNRKLYDAVKFNKKEVVEFSRRISLSKRKR